MKIIIAALIAITFSSQIALAKADPNWNRLADAIKRVEGNPDYGIRSVHYSNYQEARHICIRTCKHQYRNWVKQGAIGDFRDYLADHYCPAKTDPIGNVNWHKNIKRFYKEQ